MTTEATRRSEQTLISDHLAGPYSSISDTMYWYGRLDVLQWRIHGAGGTLRGKKVRAEGGRTSGVLESVVICLAACQAQL